MNWKRYRVRYYERGGYNIGAFWADVFETIAVEALSSGDAIKAARAEYRKMYERNAQLSTGQRNLRPIKFLTFSATQIQY
jgi:hypothetical protein